MPLEVATYITDLDADNPVDDIDQFKTTADHIRLLKQVLINTFPNLDSAVTAADKDLGLLTGMAATPTMLQPYETGAKTLFLQGVAPVGWTQVVTVNDKVFRAVDSTGEAGGTTNGTWTITGFTLGGFQLSENEIPSHSHDLLWDGASFPVAKVEAEQIGGSSNSDRGGGSNATNRKHIDLDFQAPYNGAGGPTIFGDSHTHGGNGTGATGDGTWRPKYVDTLICSKALV